jgi:hypothetical protein
MKSGLTKAFSLCFAVLTIINVNAQNIVVSENLSANSEPLKVKIGAQGFGKIAKWKFGEYAVVASKAGWTKTTSKSNLFNTKTESKTTQKFSFTMCNQAGDSALVNAAKNIETKAVQGFELFPNFRIGENELKLDSKNFTASITINRDTTDTWVLLMNSEWGSESENTGNAMLTNGNRKFLIFSASSNKNGTDKRNFPAQGYELMENDHAVLALQYYGGGAMGFNKNIVWIDNTQDQKMKLILAAAATAIMQLKMDDIAAAE